MREHGTIRGTSSAKEKQFDSEIIQELILQTVKLHCCGTVGHVLGQS